MCHNTGKGNGAFIGGYLIGAVGTRLSFRWFGLFAGAVGLIYFIINLLWLEKVVQKRHQKLTMKSNSQNNYFNNAFTRFVFVSKNKNLCTSADFI